MDFSGIWHPVDFIGCYLFGRRFIGAQSVDDVLALGVRLKSQGFKVTYNLLGEHVDNQEIVGAALRTTLELVAKMDYKNYGNVSCKPTLYGLAISKRIFQDALGKIVEDAYGRGIEVEVDAENYYYLEETFEIFALFASDPLYGNTIRQAIQAHIRNIESLMDKYGLWGKNIRVVKGSGVYKEDKGLILDDDFAVRERYLEILRRNISNGRAPFAATVRDRRLAGEIIKLEKNMNGAVDLQMLYGFLGRSLRRILLRQGCAVRIYVPFVVDWCRDAWKPYGLRRAEMVRRLFWKECRSKLGFS